MDVAVYIGTLLGLFTFLLTRPQETLVAKLFQSEGSTIPEILSLPDDKPQPIQSVHASVLGVSNIDFHTLHLYVRNGTFVEDVELIFRTSDYVSAADLASSLTTTLQAWPHSSVNFPNWSSLIIAESAGYLTISGGSYLLAFGHSADSELLLDLLGFDDIPVLFSASLITEIALLAERPTKLSIYKWAPHFDMNFGDIIRVSATAAHTLKISGLPFLARVDGISMFSPLFCTGKHILIRALRAGRLSLQRVYPKETTSGSPGTLLVYDQLYLSPATILLPGSPVTIYIEAIGAGGTSSTTAYGGAGACVSGYVRSLTSSFTISPGQTASSASSVTGSGVSVIAGGGGGGGTFAVGGSSLTHGAHGLPSRLVQNVRLGKYATLQNEGRGATNTAAGASPKGSAGLGSTGGSLTGYPKGGSGHFGGGSGGKEVFHGSTLYGGGGGGSSKATGLSFVTVTTPKTAQKTPQTTKISVSGVYGNGGNTRVAFGQGAVRILATYQ